MGKKKRQRKPQHAVRKSSENRPEAEHPGAEHQDEDHPTEEPLNEEHTSEEHPTEEQPTEEQPTEEQTTTEHSHEEHPSEEHQIEEHPFEEHLLEPIEEHPDEEHSDEEHTDAEHTDAEQTDAEHSDEEDADEAKKKFLVKKYKALDLAANLVERTGKYDLAVICYDNSLKQKIYEYGEDAEPTAYTRHCLGEMYLKIGMLDDAQEYILKALVTRLRIYLDNETDYIATWNAACSRNAAGRLLEALGKFDAAKEYRTYVDEKMLCGYEGCPSNKLFKMSELRACAACGAVYYCSRECQARD
ncbi:Sperm acrosomal protein FSA-ACR.1 [Cytospora mali]|uniref:Sperm acrosomal protein FSA-ACR.1 n=1 Tax=Cytospora mali TaxID=578113 RepID=A0A194VMK8_CYTMA|nr:Sperm acrosomal protein FSA-ACR.1 [Valsa mali]